jgi:hypothetical protein
VNPVDNTELLRAFPKTLGAELSSAVSALPPNIHGTGTFSVYIGGELLFIPWRVHHDTNFIPWRQFNSLQKHAINCILTRHSDGFVRQKYLKDIVGLAHEWVPPFVVQLVGEYVIEIIAEIEQNLSQLDRQCYGDFLTANREFLNLTARRVQSYWDVYYRNIRKEEYPGFRVLRFFQGLAGTAAP